MTRLSIRWRLTLWYGTALAVMLCVFCLLLHFLLWRQVMARTDAGLREEVKEISQEIALAEEASAFRRAAEARFTHHSFYEFLIRDSQGEVIFASSDLSGTALLLTGSEGQKQIEFLTQDFGSQGPHRMAQTYVSSQFGLLNVQVMRSLVPINADLNALQWVMAGLMPLSMIPALVIGHFLAGRALAPVQKVVDVANSIEISCLDRRIEVVNPHDEIGQLAAALNSFIARLERAVTEIRRFTADASHEIRTPIAALRTEAETTLRAPRSMEEYNRALTVIVDEATRLGRLTDQLLHLSRHDAGITSCQLDPVQLDALLQDVVDQLRSFARERRVRLICGNLATGEVLGDDIRLSQVLFNVIENGIKYTLAGGQVDIRLRFTAQGAEMDVQDSGIGIAAENLPRIFERFYRVDPSRQSEGGGAGLGLSIARAAVLAHQGTINVRSQPGVGTTVTICLPSHAGVHVLDVAQTERVST